MPEFPAQQCHRCRFASERESAFVECPECHNTVCTSCIAANLDICRDCWSRLVAKEIPKDTQDSGAPGSLKESVIRRYHNRLGVYIRIGEERNRQLDKWGDQRHTHEHWLSILTEEVGELAKALNEDGSKEEILGELIQVAAVAVAWLEDGYSRETSECPSSQT